MCSEILDIVSALSISGVIPVVAVTTLRLELMEDGIVDGEVQGDDGVAAVLCGEILDIISALSIGGVIPVVTVTTLCLELVENGIVYGEVQGDDGVAAVYVSKCVSVVTRHSEGLPVPKKTVTGCGVGVAGGGRVDRDSSRGRGCATGSDFGDHDGVNPGVVCGNIGYDVLRFRRAEIVGSSPFKGDI